MKKIIFCSQYGLNLKNSTGGQQLRIKTSIQALQKVSKLEIVSRNISFEKNKKISISKKINFFLAPSVKSKIQNNFLSFLIWRVKEFVYLKKDAEFLINLYKKNNSDYIWISYASQAFNLIKKIKQIDPTVKIIADTDSVFYKYFERRIPYVSFTKKIFLNFYYRNLRNNEKNMLKYADITTAVSQHDRKIFKKLNSKSKIMIFRNAVKKNNIKKIKHSNFNVLLSGSFGDLNSPMNVSTRWFLNKIFPLIKDKIPNLKIFIIGVNSTLEFKNDNKIIVKDWVLDISKYFALCDISAVPLKYETGTRFKILEAGVYGLPVVSTTLGAEGLNYKKNKSIIIANSVAEFAEKILYLYKNPKVAKKIAHANKKLVFSQYSINKLEEDAKKILYNII